MATIIETDTENKTEEIASAASTEKALGAVENELEHIADDVAEVEEKVEELEEKFEWNSQEKQAIWQKLESIQMSLQSLPELTERVENLETLAIVELENEGADDIQETAIAENAADVVTNDLPEMMPDDSALPTSETSKPNPLKRLLFG